MSKNKRTPLTLNIMLIILFVIGLFLAIKENINIIEFYTEDSNIIAGISSIIYVYFLIKKDKEDIPLWVVNLRYVATCCLTLTMLVVLFVLIPFMAPSYLIGIKQFMLQGSMLFHHFLCPVISIVSFTMFEKDPRLNKNKTVWLALIPTFIYGLIFVVLNILKVVVGPYPFLMVYNQTWYMSIIWVVIIFALNYTIARMILYLNQKV